MTDFREAVQRGSVERLAPVLMTALTTGLGLVPLALSGSQPSNEIQTPLAIVVLFGLFSSRLLNMVVVPALFLRWAKPTPPKIHIEDGEIETSAHHPDSRLHTHWERKEPVAA